MTDTAPVSLVYATAPEGGEHEDVSCFIIGLVFRRLRVDARQFTAKDALVFNLFQISSNAIAWMIVAPFLDVIIYSESPNRVFSQRAAAALCNMVSAGIIGTLLLFLYSKICSGRETPSRV